jgi:hypothetical protein
VRKNGGRIPSKNSPLTKGSCEKIEDRLLPARSVRRSARSTQVEGALRTRFGLWIQNRDRSEPSRFNFFTAPGGGGEAVWRLSYNTGKLNIDGSTMPSAIAIFPLRRYRTTPTPSAPPPFVKGELPPCRRSAISSRLPGRDFLRVSWRHKLLAVPSGDSHSADRSGLVV